MPDNTFTWLHLSDLHVGMQSQGWLWPNFKSVLYEDLRRVHAKTGAWDVVIFSGDVTQKGSAKEFDRATQIFRELWSEFEKLGFSPKLFVVPGNHDLARPDPASPAAIVMKHWWTTESVRKTTWESADNPYRQLLDSAFSGYVDWLKSLEAHGIELVAGTSGLAPGDVASTMESGGLKIGLVGLNSTWLQLDGEDATGQLAIEVRQLNELTGNSPQAWVEGHDLNLVVTHHPTDWLHPAAVSDWLAEISPGGRFDAHLYGHMHEPDVVSTSHGGSPTRRSIQAASLFGLEKIDSLNVDRLHGYSVAQFRKGKGIYVWPRRHTLLRNRSWKLVADQSLDLDEDGSFLLTDMNTSGSGVATSLGAAVRAPLVAGFPISRATSDQALEKVRYYLPPSPASLNVRRVEQRIASNALIDKRAVWVTAQWGSNSNGFLRAIQEHAGDLDSKTYRVDVNGYEERSEFLSGLKSKIGINFEQLCEALSETGSSYLVLEDVPTTTTVEVTNAPSVVADIEDLVATLLSYCPKAKVILRTRQVPRSHSFPAVTLRQLDEADLSVYLGDHEHGGPRFSKPEAVSAIYRHTDGVPARVDDALRELEVVPLSALTTTNQDIARLEGSRDTPLALVSAVQDLKSSEDPARQRSFDLLRALSAFPQGETIGRLKRFYGAFPIHPAHAHELLDRSLISANAAASGPGSDAGSDERILTVPRPVRDYVRSLAAADELTDLTTRAATLYFGDAWHLGELRPSLSGRYSKPIASIGEIENACAIILRLLNDAIERADDRALETACSVAKGFVVPLFKGDHFRSVVTFSTDMLRALPTDQEATREFFLYQQSKATRMMGDDAKAVEMLESLNPKYLTKDMKQAVLISLSLAHQALGDSVGAVSAANQAIKMDRHSNRALQARSVILDEHEDEEYADAELLKLEAVCRKKGVHVVANNIALTRIGKKPDSPEAEAAVADVLRNSSKANDFYNTARAIIRKASNQINTDAELTEKEKDLLISSYLFLLGERLPLLFDRCHAALWNVFEKSDESGNLFSLFRHSSLIWRLRGDRETEARYLKKLARHAQSVIARDFGRLDKEIAYYLIRRGEGAGEIDQRQLSPPTEEVVTPQP